MINRLALVRESASPVGHQPLPLGIADRGAEIGFLAETAFALPALGNIGRNDMIIDRNRSHAWPDFADNARAFVTQHAREFALTVKTVERIGVGMANPRGHDLDQNFPLLWPLEIEFDNLQRFLPLQRRRRHGFSWARISTFFSTPVSGTEWPMIQLARIK